jgi:plasmid stability protein
MTRQALPLYLPPEQHRALKELSARTGRSMSDLVRELLDRYLLGDTPPTDISDLAGVVDLGRPTDVARDLDAMLDDALRDLR